MWFSVVDSRKKIICQYLPHKYTKEKKGELAFELFRSKVLVLILGALMFAIFEVFGRLHSFCEFSGKQK